MVISVTVIKSNNFMNVKQYKKTTSPVSSIRFHEWAENSAFTNILI